jgi:hypothetical protein
VVSIDGKRIFRLSGISDIHLNKMANAAVVAYNIAAFLSTLFLLEFGADKFIDHTAIVARRTRIPETIIGLLTAGGEWEEVRHAPFNIVIR